MYTERDTFFRYILLCPNCQPKFLAGVGWYLRPDEIVYIGNRSLPGATGLMALVQQLKYVD